MTRLEFEKICINNEYGQFRPIYTFEKEEPIEDEEGNIIDYEMIRYAQTATAEEEYQKYLADKANPPIPAPTEIEKLKADIEYLSAMTGVTI